MKKNVFMLISLMGLTTLVSSCGISSWECSRIVKIKGTPNVDFYVRNQKSDCDKDGFVNFGARKDLSYYCKEDFTFIGSTNAEGEGEVKVSTQDYKRSKKAIAMKSGFEAEKVRLKKRFNWAVLVDIIFPPALFFDHYGVLSERKTNRVLLKDSSPYNCYEYFDMAMKASREKEKLAYFWKAVEQDYRNENGVKAYALNNMGLLYANNGNTHLAYLYLKKAEELSADCGAKDNLVWLKTVVEQQNARKAMKEEKWNRAMSTMDALATGLNAVANTLEQSSAGESAGSLETPVGEGKGTTGRSASQKANTKSQHSMSEMTNKNADSRTYSNYETQLIRMNTYHEREYNDSRRRDIQNQMRNIRQKWESRGYKMFRSEWETWDGRKR